MFGFEQDGICDNGAGPVPSGCEQIGSPGTPCDPTSGNPCAFPPVPGQPGANPNAYPNSTQNGYEGPRNYYSNVSTDTTSGVVNFSPALQPGQSTYFSLEEPPSAASLNAIRERVSPLRSIWRGTRYRLAIWSFSSSV